MVRSIIRTRWGFHVREDVAPLKPGLTGYSTRQLYSFHVREDVAPLKLAGRERPRLSFAGFHVREDVAPLKPGLGRTLVYTFQTFPRS